MPLEVEISVPSNATYLQQKVDDVGAALQENHPGKIFDSAKNLLETTLRTIVTSKCGQVALQNDREPSLMNLYEQTIKCFEGLSSEQGAATKFDELCKKAVQMIGYCRNNYGYSGHGQDGYTTFSINPIEAIFVSNVAVALVNFLYGSHVIQPTSYQNIRLVYGNYDDFNNYIDDTNDELVISGIVMAPSEALFMADQSAYRELLIEYTENPPEQPNDEDEAIN